MSSRISQLNMIDILYTAYVHKRYDECMEQFRKTHIAKSEGPEETKTHCKGGNTMIDLSVLVTESRNKGDHGAGPDDAPGNCYRYEPGGREGSECCGEVLPQIA